MTVPKRLFDILAIQAKHYPDSNVLNTKYEGVWKGISTKEYKEKADQMSRAFLNLGVKFGDKIALISTNNRTEWCIVDMGLSQIGAVNVPIYPSISGQDYAYIINHSESIYCFVSDKEVLSKLVSVKEKCPNLKNIYTFDQVEGYENWNEALKLGKDIAAQTHLELMMERIQPHDLATIIYTSGTTGKPKGVMLSHQNIVSNVIASEKRLPLGFGGEVALSFLPICHIYERMLSYLYLHKRVNVYFAEGLDTISENLNEVHPNIMTAVPRLLEKLYDKIYAKGQSLSGIKKKLFNWAVQLGLQYEPYRQNGWWFSLKLSVARLLIFNKWKAALGGKLEIIASGSAALQPRLARIFTAAGITICEGYGLSETSPVISVNDMRNNGFRIGTVGKIIEKVEVKIAEDGEIICKGPNVMMGYYKDEKLTNKILKDNYFHTGDIGHIDQDGFLKITDRKKEIFKTSGGKYIAPQVIENVMKQSIFIDHIMVVGEGEKHPSAFIQPNFESILNWSVSENLNIDSDPKNIIAHDLVIEKIQQELNFYNKNFGSWEKLKKFSLTADTWTVDSGHLTPTMKLRRRVLMDKYQKEYLSMYPST